MSKDEVEAHIKEHETLRAQVGTAQRSDEALKFIQRLSGPNRGCHIISSGNLSEFQIAFARANGLFFVDGEGLGYAMLPLPKEMVPANDFVTEAQAR